MTSIWCVACALTVLVRPVNALNRRKISGSGAHGAVEPAKAVPTQPKPGGEDVTDGCTGGEPPGRGLAAVGDRSR